MEAAHEQDVVHRDLKPANVKIRTDRTVKVLDFGLARAFQPARRDPSSSQLPTLASPATQIGTILGTAAYMSPEQARGEPADQRSDIWSFGVVLFEMLTGQRLFASQSVSETLAEVLRDEIEWARLPSETPTSVRRLLRRCLERDARRRLQHIGDARLELDDARVSPDVGGSGPERRAGPRPRVVGLVAIGLVGAFLVGGALLRTPTDAPPPARYSIGLPPEAPLVVGKAIPLGFDLPLLDVSPDGSQLVYVADLSTTSQLYLSTIGEFGGSPLAGTEGATHPFFSPDGEWIACVSGTEIKKVSLAGGRPEMLHAVNTAILGTAWCGDDIYFVDSVGSTLRRVSASGGDSRLISRADSLGYANFCPVAALPDGGGLLLTSSQAAPMSGDYRDILSWSSSSGEWKTLLEGAGYDGRYAPSGHLVYLRGGDGSVGVPRWLDRAGNAEPLDIEPAFYGAFSLSPDGRQLAIHVGGRVDQVWIYDLASGQGRSLTTAGNNGWPLWSPDGEHVVFSSNRSGSWGLYLKAADGGGKAVELVHADTMMLPSSWSDRDNLIVLTDNDATGELVQVDPSGMVGERLPYPQEFGEWGYGFSRDGRWLAYTSDRGA